MHKCQQCSALTNFGDHFNGIQKGAIRAYIPAIILPPEDTSSKSVQTAEYHWWSLDKLIKEIKNSVEWLNRESITKDEFDMFYDYALLNIYHTDPDAQCLKNLVYERVRDKVCDIVQNASEIRSRS
jgi:hypothetical protein